MIMLATRGAPLPSPDDVQRRLGLGQDPGQPGLTVSEWLDTWLAAKRRTKRESTCRGYEMHIRTWLQPQLGHLPLERLNYTHIEDLSAAIERVNRQVVIQRAAGVAPMDVKIDGDVRGQARECGPTTQLRVFATLRAALNAAVKQRKIGWNPCAGVELEHPETPARRRWTPTEAVHFIDHTANDEMGLMFQIAVLRAPRRRRRPGHHPPRGRAAHRQLIDAGRGRGSRAPHARGRSCRPVDQRSLHAPAGAGAPSRSGTDGGPSEESEEVSMTGTNVPQMFPDVSEQRSHSLPERLHRRSGVVGRVGLEPTTGRL